MFLSFSDESGTGNINLEPNLVVAAIVVNPDEQWNNMERAMRELVLKYVPEQLREGYEFHAYKIFRQLHKGNNRQLLTELLHIPEKCKIPIFKSVVSRTTMREWYPNYSAKELLEITETIAFLMCAKKVEFFFSAFRPEEKILWIADRVNIADGIKKHIKRLQDAPAVGTLLEVKLNHIIDTIYFGDSRDSLALQLADAVNFVIRGHFTGKKGIDQFYKLLPPCSPQDSFVLIPGHEEMTHVDDE
jgi:hypothetical protein